MSDLDPGREFDLRSVEPVGVVMNVCATCRHFERPPASNWPSSAFGACTNPENVVITPGGWGRGDALPAVTDMMCCSNHEAKE